MNAFYVLVSIPILMVLARCHAHGLSTFGIKSGNQAQAEGTRCSNQSTCQPINGATCLNNYCLCGDNTHPVNGVCKKTPKGPKHKCENDDDCVVGATCVDPKDQKPNSFKSCQCQEGLVEKPGKCSGMSNFIVVPSLLLISAIVVKIY